MATPPSTLAGKIRAKYPGAYDNLSDSDLEQKIIAKYPQYKDMATPAAPSSSVPTGASIADQLAAKTTGISAGPTGPIAKLRQMMNPTQQGAEQHPIEAAAGSFLNSLKQMTVGGQGGGLNLQTGFLTNPAIPLVFGAGGAAATKVASALPSAERAGAALNEVRQAAGSIPISMAKPGNTALELMTQSERGASLPKAVRQFVQRAANPNLGPVTYEEAKDFQSNISNLSANEKMAIKPNTARLLGQLNADLKDSLKGAADVVGKGDTFAKAMQEYHSAMRLAGWTENAISNGWNAALTAAKVGGLAKILNLSSK